jgi:alanine-glyoxylate transaminase / serine-glyoxylate transaminase / serine-pyruvate transaminase
MPDGHDADRFRAIVLERFNMSLGAGLGRFKGRAFRIGHLGDFNDLMLAGTLCGVEMGLAVAGVPFQRGGVERALASLCAHDFNSQLPTPNSQAERVESRGNQP